ncbi:hypothetical protein KBTX_02116 [wastewater metagenome]|uniref:Uncharacterized protein n=2 Tax=unclassified sequences TaxID=12908 RepID=A0A5B8RE93_9ZZZZ|nr:hypothetical protein KBTEX_02116 [uncultured organism]
MHAVLGLHHREREVGDLDAHPLALAARTQPPDAHQVGARTRLAGETAQPGLEVEAEAGGRVAVLERQVDDLGDAGRAQGRDLRGDVVAPQARAPGRRLARAGGHGVVVDADRAVAVGPELQVQRVDGVDAQVDAGVAAAAQGQHPRPLALHDRASLATVDAQKVLAGRERQVQAVHAGGLQRPSVGVPEIAGEQAQAVARVGGEVAGDAQLPAGEVVLQVVHRGFEAHEVASQHGAHVPGFRGEADLDGPVAGGADQRIGGGVGHPAGGGRPLLAGAAEARRAERLAGGEGDGLHRLVGAVVQGQAQPHQRLAPGGDGFAEAQHVVHRRVAPGPFGAFDGEVVRAQRAQRLRLDTRQGSHLDGDHLLQGVDVHRIAEAQRQGIHRRKVVAAIRGPGLDGRGHERRQAVAVALEAPGERREGGPGLRGAELEGVCVQPGVGSRVRRGDGDVLARVGLRAAVLRPAGGVEEQGDRVPAAQEVPGHDHGAVGSGGWCGRGRGRGRGQRLADQQRGQCQKQPVAPTSVRRSAHSLPASCL